MQITGESRQEHVHKFNRSKEEIQVISVHVSFSDWPLHEPLGFAHQPGVQRLQLQGLLHHLAVPHDDAVPGPQEFKRHEPHGEAQQRHSGQKRHERPADPQQTRGSGREQRERGQRQQRRYLPQRLLHIHQDAFPCSGLAVIEVGEGKPVEEVEAVIVGMMAVIVPALTVHTQMPLTWRANTCIYLFMWDLFIYLCMFYLFIY